jgi:hypothetical protein
VGDLVEVDPFGRERLPPTGKLAVDAVEQELNLGEKHGDQGGPYTGKREHEGREQPGRHHQGGDLVRRYASGDE